MDLQQYHFDLFADYFQFCIQDEQADSDLSNNWTQEGVDRKLALGSGTIGIGTARNMTVPVDIAISDTMPVDDDFSLWDQVNECSIHVPTGRLVIAGGSDYFPEATRLSVTPGWHRARIYYGGLNTLSEDGLEGEDHYRVVLWPAPHTEVRILK
jgi:hypothetical protein